MSTEATTARPPVKLGVLISGEGTNLQAIIDAIDRGELKAEIRVAISNKAAAPGLERARRYAIPTEVIDHRGWASREEFDRALVDSLRAHEVELVVCAGFMRLFSPVMVAAFRERIMNIHPALCPAFPGVDAQKQALDYGVRFSGCTVFFVTEGVDDGPVIAQAVVPVNQDDDEKALAARIHLEEHRIYTHAIRLYQEGRLEVRGRKVHIRDAPPIDAAVSTINPRLPRSPPALILKLAVIVPMLNEESAIAATLDAIRIGAPAAEIIVVDGGSSDRSIEIARLRCDKLIESPRGRARQMNAGASLASAVSADALAFVHADTLVPPTFARDIEAALADGRVVGGRFDVAFDVRGRVLDIVAAMINLRSRVARSATGDQAIFVRREVFERLGGYADIELCEDVDFARRMRRAGRVACLRARAITSSRRWRRDGLVRTVVKMWIIKSLFLSGVSPAWLKRHYADIR